MKTQNDDRQQQLAKKPEIPFCLPWGATDVINLAYF